MTGTVNPFAGMARCATRFASTRLFLAVAGNRLPKGVFHSVAPLTLILAVYVCVLSLNTDFMWRLAQPWLHDRPHAVFSVTACDQFPSEAINRDLARQGLPRLVSACVGRGDGSLITLPPSYLRVTPVMVLEMRPELFAVMPALAQTRGQDGPAAACLPDEVREKGVTSLLGGLQDGGIESRCKRQRLAPLAINRVAALGTDLEPGQTAVLAAANASQKDVMRVLDASYKGPERRLIVASSAFGMAELPAMAFVPEGGLGTLAGSGRMILIRVADAASKREIERALDVMKRHVDGKIMGASILESKELELEALTTNLLYAIGLIVLFTVGLIATISTNQFIQRERRFFAIARVCGFTNGAVFVVIVAVEIIACLLSTALGLVVGFGFCEAIRYFLPEVGYRADWSMLAIAGAAMTMVCLLSSAWMMKKHFDMEIAAEFQNVSESE